jgi:predicted dehydrogenase
MSHAPIRVGLIGLGIIGQRVAKQFAASPETPITYVCDRDTDLAQRTAAEFGAAAWSADYREMLRGDQVDLVYVGVPPRLHRQIALDVVAAGKHLFCEKPLALTLPEAREMAEAVAGSNLVGAVNLPINFDPGIQVFADQLAAGYIGQLRRIDLNLVFPQWPRAWQQNPWIGGREQGGAIREVGPHMFHVILKVFGQVTRVFAHMEYPADPAAAELGATGLLELASGQMVSVNLLCNVPRTETVSLTAYGTEGTLGLVNWSRPVGSKGDGPLEPIEAPAREPLRTTEMLRKAIRGEQAGLATFEMGLAIQRVLDAWERSSESGNWESLKQ